MRQMTQDSVLQHIIAEFKLKNGFSHQEIHAKTLSLKVSLSHTHQMHLDLLKEQALRSHYNYEAYKL